MPQGFTTIYCLATYFCISNIISLEVLHTSCAFQTSFSLQVLDTSFASVMLYRTLRW